ncbi:hypothetical protein HNO88_000768 [Novosphingobium chloroacetimidivorans]|uniref:SPOR domain-containing protein n=1 Tax=Novosphingobium chloroacetimidivorans TaxID=1428314 RepID=A0A7W7K7T0_9SPHN|nr:SPOR domain-containing protein [Novosphingobium chloroacetimidivorans]MBB4857461.1 hypothetical protein [Novosphingobium chloroacetimidivorans]
MAMSFPGEGGREEPGFQHGDGTAAPTSGADQRPFDSRFEETGELDLGEEDVRLPWLEGDDDDYEDAGSNTGQLIALVLLGLAALALIVGGIWWLQRDRPDTTLVADGETIQAPAAPYKTKPANPGGEVVAGTGDTSFAVAEGQTRQVRMGSDAPAPAPTPKAAASPSAAASEAAPADVSGVGVQVGAYSNRESAEAGWTRLSSQYEALASVKHRIVEGRADIGTVYRLQAVPGDAAAANRLCGTLKAAGLSCQVKR